MGQHKPFRTGRGELVRYAGRVVGAVLMKGVGEEGKHG
jgi:hypothetical protein